MYKEWAIALHKKILIVQSDLFVNLKTTLIDILFANSFIFKCKVGSSVAIRVGGDFYFAPEIGDPSHDLLLIAGGVGLNPLASIFSHACHLYKLHQENSEEYCPGKIKLLYSAKTYEDLLYKVSFVTVMDSKD